MLVYGKVHVITCKPGKVPQTSMKVPIIGRSGICTSQYSPRLTYGTSRQGLGALVGWLICLSFVERKGHEFLGAWSDLFGSVLRYFQVNKPSPAPWQMDFIEWHTWTDFTHGCDTHNRA